jgi:threonine/homoserine/homoserine lactone efflux protein
MLTAIANAVVLGFAISVPVGPVSLLCMHRTLTQGRAAGFATGLGIATADASYAVLVAGGFSVSAELQWIEAPWVKLAAGILVALVGLKILAAPAVQPTSGISQTTLPWCYISGFLLTLTNPASPLLLIAGFAVLDLVEPAIDLARGSLLIAGIFLGCLLWWVSLVTGVGMVGRQVPLSVLRVVNRATGGIFIVLAAVAIGHALFQG